MHCRLGLVVFAAMASAVSACAQPSGDYRLEVAFPQLTFRKPVDLQHAGDARLFVLEQAGVIRVFAGDPAVKTSTVFLDISDRVSTEGNEMGLLGLAFPSDFSTNGQFFVYYTADDGQRVGRLSRFSVSARAPDLGDAASEVVVLEVEQRWSNHNGGGLAFGPDGFLYLGLGDGGAAGDPAGNAQNPGTLLGAVIRIDVSELPYRIPEDNPFAGNAFGHREEIFAYGLRNPWRLSFDPETGWLWVGDVGQVTWEEVNVVESGRNYGWDCREGYHPYQPVDERSPACAGADDFAPPAWVYGRDEGQSITGGFVYRGSRLPELVGWYIYADYATGRVWALFYDGARVQNRLLTDTDLLISSLGVSSSGALYLCEHDPDGGKTKIYRLAASGK